MADVLVERTSLTDAADAIREKLEIHDLIKPEDFAEEILKISGGGETSGIDDFSDFPEWSSSGPNDFYCKVWYHPCTVSWQLQWIDPSEAYVSDPDTFNAYMNSTFPSDSSQMAMKDGDTWQFQNGTTFVPEEIGLWVSEYANWLELAKAATYSGGPESASTIILTENQLSCLCFAHSSVINTLPNGDLIVSGAIEGVDLIYDNPTFPDNFCANMTSLKRMTWRLIGTANFGRSFLQGSRGIISYPLNLQQSCRFIDVTTTSLPYMFLNSCNLMRGVTTGDTFNVKVSESIGDYVLLGAKSWTPSISTYIDGSYRTITVGQRFGVSAELTYAAGFLPYVTSCGADCEFPVMVSSLTLTNLTNINNNSNSKITLIASGSGSLSVSAPVFTKGKIYVKATTLVISR